MKSFFRTSTRRFTAAFAAGLIAVSAVPFLSAAQADTGETHMHRLYNRITREHLYTSDLNEVTTLVRGDWSYEGVGWVAPASSSTPVYRLYHKKLGDHHYSLDANEIKTLTKKYGWKNEGIAWYSSDSQKNIPIYRQFNPRFHVGSHNYTANKTEYDINNARNGWRNEGIAWYALRTGWQTPTVAKSLTYVSMPFSLDTMTNYQKQNPYNNNISFQDLRAILNPNNVNPLSPQYYQFVGLNSYTGLSAQEINAFITSTSTGRSGTLVGLGDAFTQAAQANNINEAYLVAHAILESGWGTSQLARGYYYDGTTPVDGKLYPAGTYYNYFGIGAVDSGPLSGGRAMAIKNGWNSPRAAIAGGAQWISHNYIHGTQAGRYNQNTLYDMKWDYQRSAATYAYGWHQYATDRGWAEKNAVLMQKVYASASRSIALDYIVPRYR